MSSSSNRPATPSDAPPAATPEGLTNWLLLAMNEAFEMRASKRASVILRAIDAAGYAVVPREPTRAMVIAGDQCQTSECVYEAMLAAGRVMP